MRGLRDQESKVSAEPPISVTHLFQPEREALLDTLRGLEPAAWRLATVCEGWTVKDVALHVLAGDIGIVARKRDGFSMPLPEADSFVEALNRHNDIWIDAARRFSEPLVVDLLEYMGPQAFAVLGQLDPLATGRPIYWVGPDPAPVWLDIAREYTERWHHQQHIREAAGRPGLLDARFGAPALRTFTFALPWAYRDLLAPAGVSLELGITGAAGGAWTLTRTTDGWEIREGMALEPEVTVSLSDDIAWRTLTGGVAPRDAEAAATVRGDRALALPLFAARGIIV
jgi:uncharacterized protein (TIGR03083 family)